VQIETDRPLAIPLIPFEPQLVAQWEHLWGHELVELRSNGLVLGRGQVDMATADATTIWVHLASGRGRIMIHEQDGVDIWRVDPGKNQPDPPATSGEFEDVQEGNVELFG
jgi:hypothetical protein